MEANGSSIPWARQLLWKRLFVSVGPGHHFPTPVAGKPMFLEGPEVGIEKTNKLEENAEEADCGNLVSPSSGSQGGGTSRCIKPFGYAILIHSSLPPLDGHSSGFLGYESRPFSNSSQILQQDSFSIFAHGPEQIDR